MKGLVSKEIDIRECETLDELAACVDLQSEVFALPEIEISPVRHFVVTKNAGGFTLGAYAGEKLIGFVLSVPAILAGGRSFYSHMTAVSADFQSCGVGAKLKWAQRDRALKEGVRYIKWTFEPWKARNAFFNLEKLGATVREYQPNFYGIDYVTASTGGEPIGLASDRLFAEWDLESEKVVNLAAGEKFIETRTPELVITVPNDWNSLVNSSPDAAIDEQKRIKAEFESAFAKGLICRGFIRDDSNPRYLLYKD